VLAAAAGPLLPGEVDDPIREAIVAALQAMLMEHQYRAEIAAAQADPARAVEGPLRALASDRALGSDASDDDESVRNRIFALQSVVTEEVLATAIDAVLAPHTTLRCHLVDGVLDRLYVSSGGAATWRSFIGAGPSYPSRLFEDDAPNNGGHYRPNTRVGGARLFDDAVGRQLLVRVPDLGGLGGFGAFSAASLRAPDQVGPGGFFAGDGTDPDVAAFVSQGATAQTVYAAVVRIVRAAIGQSVRFLMIADVES